MGPAQQDSKSVVPRGLAWGEASGALADRSVDQGLVDLYGSNDGQPAVGLAPGDEQDEFCRRRFEFDQCDWLGKAKLVACGLASVDRRLAGPARLALRLHHALEAAVEFVE